MSETKQKSQALASPSKGFIHLGISGDISIAGTSMAVNSTMPFSLTKSSFGMTASGNGIDLKAGVTYRLEAMVNCYALDNLQFMGFKFAKADNTQLGEMFYSTPPTSAQSYCFMAGGLMFYTPSVNETLYIKVVDKSANNGYVTGAWNSYFIATEM